MKDHDAPHPLDLHPPTRAAGLTRLRDFLPDAARAYATNRNYDLAGHPHVSQLSPYLRHRLVTEPEVVAATVARHSPSSAEKYLSEVFWRTYFKGWLELRPSVWTMYREGVRRGLDRVQTESGLRAEWEAACKGDTGIACFDHWAQELVSTGYLHNHARMWFASIWCFTLRLPWELGADFFLRHLLDGDPASNTLGWRWVAGLQTPGKTYLARPDNIAKYTEGRFEPSGQLAQHAEPVDGAENPPRSAPPESGRWSREGRTALLLTEDDLSPEFLLDEGLSPTVHAVLSGADGRSPLTVADHVTAFTQGAIDDTLARLDGRAGSYGGRFDGDDAARAVNTWAQEAGVDQIVMPYSPTGPAADRIAQLRGQIDGHGIRLVAVIRPEDARAWPHATHGFFKFKDKIPELIGSIRGLSEM